MPPTIPSLDSIENIELAAIPSYEFEGGLIFALILAFAGGLLLNLMPCVLPVISFKILSFVKLAGESKKLILRHGLAFSGGVLLSFWVLAALLLLMQEYGKAVGWGFQLQEPIFVALLASFLFLFGLSSFGVFEFGTSLMATAGQINTSSQRNALTGSFLSGVLATVVATPCTGPFLGSAVGYAVTLPAFQAMLVFSFLGLGMSSPYILLSAFPSLLRFLPKPGQWMITFKELMGFLMMASVVWLIWVFSAQTGTGSVTLLIGGFFFLALASWIFGQWATPVQTTLTRGVASVLSLAVLGVGAYIIFIAATSSFLMDTDSRGSIIAYEDGVKKPHGAQTSVWEEFSPKRVAELRAQGIPVFIDFTAKWCLICQSNHSLVLSTHEAPVARARFSISLFLTRRTARTPALER